MTKKNISSAQLIQILQSWGGGNISTEKLQLWMLDNFEPEEFDIGKGESGCVSEAMHIVMNEYELADQKKCQSEQFQLAIDFINCDEDSFVRLKTNFLRNGFTD